MIIRAKTFKRWLQANLDRNELRGLAEHGADAGWPGLTYYRDTCKLYERFKEEIWDLLVEEAEYGGGYDNPFAFVAVFRGAKDVGTVDQFENLMVWYAAEHYARLLTDDGAA